MEIFTEEELLPLSLLQHLLFCDRRAALIQIEGLWKDNLYTVEGTQLHQKVDGDQCSESRGDLYITRGLLLHSFALGLSGKTDVVEFHRLTEDLPTPQMKCGEKVIAIPLAGTNGLWSPYPVDYKRGKMRREVGFEAQLCAQAICLEEMLGVEVAEGAIYYGKNRRRLMVSFDEKLRRETIEAAARLHELVRSGKTPPARYGKKCESCSLVNICLPKVTGAGKNVVGYLSRMLAR
ncbi:MAG TPA: CRISPR-associated protein Cas4 [Desulfobacteraceae bacterium]|nr:CRISPR-associated protein Cas4 [Desulfobacteraceae bacterium]